MSVINPHELLRRGSPSPDFPVEGHGRDKLPVRAEHNARRSAIDVSRRAAWTATADATSGGKHVSTRSKSRALEGIPLGGGIAHSPGGLRPPCNIPRPDFDSVAGRIPNLRATPRLESLSVTRETHTQNSTSVTG
jgi:hypothetical protein